MPTTSYVFKVKNTASCPFLKADAQMVDKTCRIRELKGEGSIGSFPDDVCLGLLNQKCPLSNYRNIVAIKNALEQQAPSL